MTELDAEGTSTIVNHRCSHDLVDEVSEKPILEPVVIKATPNFNRIFAVCQGKENHPQHHTSHGYLKNGKQR